MDGFTGFKTATAEEMPDAVRGAWTPSTSSAWPATPWTSAGAASSWPSTDTVATRTTRSTAARRTLHTGADLLTEKQKDRLDALFAADAHVEVEATWGIYQRMIAAYRHPDRAQGRELMVKLIDSISHGVPSRAHRDHHPRADPEEARRRRPGLLRPARHQQRTDRSDQRPPRTPPRLRPRLPQPHELHPAIHGYEKRPTQAVPRGDVRTHRLGGPFLRSAPQLGHVSRLQSRRTRAGQLFHRRRSVLASARGIGSPRGFVRKVVSRSYMPVTGGAVTTSGRLSRRR